MDNVIDCLLVGHYEMDFGTYESTVRKMGANSGAYRDLNLNFIRHGGRALSLPDVVNTFGINGYREEKNESFTLGNIFSATIAYLGSFLDKRGLTFDYVNSLHGDKSRLEEKLRSSKYRVIAITTTLYTSIFPIIELVHFIRKHDDTVRIAVGGPFVATQVRNQSEDTLSYLLKLIGADFYINSSQGEQALAALVETVKSGAGAKDIKNIYYREQGQYIYTATEPENNILQENTVNWELFADSMGEMVNVRTAISCPFSCAFCGFPEHAGKYQTMDVEAIEQELDKLNRSGKVKCVNFIDDTFNVPKDRFREILKMMIRNKYSFRWTSYLRCQYVDEEIIGLMKESGCMGVFLGIESGNEEILRNMNKNTTLDKYREGIALLNESGIITFASFIVGFPGETRETVEDTIRFIEETRPAFFRAQSWYCEPITPIWREKDKYNITGSNFEWAHQTMDSHTAGRLVEEVFHSVKNSIWIPQYSFDITGVYYLLSQGMSIEDIKKLLTYFNAGIKERLAGDPTGNISSDTAAGLKSI